MHCKNGTKIVSEFQRLHGEIGRTVSDVRKHDVTGEDLEHVLAPRKLLGVRRIVLPLGGAENLGETRPLNLKPP